MLVLSRKPGDTIVVADDVVITIVELKGGKVRVGISAPPSVVIRRGELLSEPPPVEVQVSVHNSPGPNEKPVTLPVR